MGDIHGEYGRLNQFLNKNRGIDIILQCGDFGYWPRQHGMSWTDMYGRLKQFDQYSLKNMDTMIFWCDGNHEDFQSLKDLQDNEIMKNVYYMERGVGFNTRRW